MVKWNTRDKEEFGYIFTTINGKMIWIVQIDEKKFTVETDEDEGFKVWATSSSENGAKRKARELFC